MILPRHDWEALQPKNTHCVGPFGTRTPRCTCDTGLAGSPDVTAADLSMPGSKASRSKVSATYTSEKEWRQGKACLSIEVLTRPITLKRLSIGAIYCVEMLCRPTPDRPDQQYNGKTEADVPVQYTPPASTYPAEEYVPDSTQVLADDFMEQAKRCPSGAKQVGIQAWSGCLTPSACECGICLDHKAGVEVVDCGHTLCTGCALQLCLVSGSMPSCPFCRCLMQGFKAAFRSE